MAGAVPFAAGELQVRGEGIFKAYYGRSRSTGEVEVHDMFDISSRRRVLCLQAFSEDFMHSLQEKVLANFA